MKVQTTMKCVVIFLTEKRFFSTIWKPIIEKDFFIIQTRLNDYLFCLCLILLFNQKAIVDDVINKIRGKELLKIICPSISHSIYFEINLNKKRKMMLWVDVYPWEICFLIAKLEKRLVKYFMFLKEIFWL